MYSTNDWDCRSGQAITSSGDCLTLEQLGDRERPLLSAKWCAVTIGFHATSSVVGERESEQPELREAEQAEEVSGWW